MGRFERRNDLLIRSENLSHRRGTEERPDEFRLFELLPIENNAGNISSGCGTARARVKDVKPLRYVARQPISDWEERVFGYELLFRDGLENAFNEAGDEAWRATLDRSLLMGRDALCDRRRAGV